MTIAKKRIFQKLKFVAEIKNGFLEFIKIENNNNNLKRTQYLHCVYQTIKVNRIK